MERKNGKQAKEEGNSSAGTLLDRDVSSAASEFERLNIRDSEPEEEQSSEDGSTVTTSDIAPSCSELEENAATVSASSAQNSEAARNRADEDNVASGEENTTASVANPSSQRQAELRRERSGTTYISTNRQVLLMLDRRRRRVVVRERISYRRYHSFGQIRNELPTRVLRLPSRRAQDASASSSSTPNRVRRSRFWFIPGNPRRVLPSTQNTEDSQVESQSQNTADSQIESQSQNTAHSQIESQSQNTAHSQIESQNPGEVQVITVFLRFIQVGDQAEILNLFFVARVAEDLEIHHIFFTVFHS